MTNEILLALMGRCKIKDGEELIPGVAYLFNRQFLIPIVGSHDRREEYEIIILLYRNKKAGTILRYGSADIHWTVLEKYQGKHILSDFLKLSILKSIWPTNTKTELVDIWSRDEYLKKRHLAELAGLQI